LIDLNLWTGKQEYLATSVNALCFLGGIVAVIGHLDLPSAKVKVATHYEQPVDCDPVMGTKERF
jgi:hypothetical protein